MSACENHESETKRSFVRVQIFIDLFIHLVPPNSCYLSFGPWICQSFQIWRPNINHLCFGPWYYLIIDTSLISRLNSVDCISDLCFRSERTKISLFSFQTKNPENQSQSSSFLTLNPPPIPTAIPPLSPYLW